MSSKALLPETGAGLPRHVAIIMDGNGRWAKKRLLNRVKGHEKGVDAVRTIVRTCRELRIEVLTLYAFSTENWQRPIGEINALMSMLKRFLDNEAPELQENNIRLGVIGQPQRLPAAVRETIEHVQTVTAGNDGMLLNLALSYGGRTEITEMVRAIASKVADGSLPLQGIDEAVVADHLYTRGVPDPDLMIRTSGEMRISNFLLWQLAYSEIYITETLWPDFSREEFIEILKQYQTRDRRFGKVGPS
ncbi:MAG: UDP pyrophosphate synthase [Desulfatitalea sp. BRH_c12]|nr:MAG: UDP pyrophosphate synthase [Desulfatitalea sp. BRH_c12]